MVQCHQQVLLLTFVYNWTILWRLLQVKVGRPEVFQRSTFGELVVHAFRHTVNNKRMKQHPIDEYCVHLPAATSLYCGHNLAMQSG